MAVSTNKYASNLVLELYVDTDDEGKDIKKTKSISRIDEMATNEQLYAIGMAIVEVLKYEVIEIRRIDKNVLLG